MNLRSQRVLGCLAGVAAGDHNGGPVQMALRVCQTLQERTRLDSNLIYAKYLKWFFNKEDGYDDTGPVAIEIFRSARKTFKIEDFSSEEVIEKKLNEKDIEKISKNVDKELEGQTAGVNGAHRGCILSMFANYSTSDLLQVAKQETQLTHYHKIAYQGTQIAALLCRILIEHGPYDGKFWWEHLTEQLELHQVKLDDAYQIRFKSLLGSEDKFLETVRDYEEGNANNNIRRDGFSPNTIRSALFFLRKHVSKEAITSNKPEKEMIDACFKESFKFAGKANYCPVLVGAFLGAMFGEPAIRHHITVCECVDQVNKVGTALAQEWE
jgi:ADP-ribosylglycohydrolase